LANHITSETVKLLVVSRERSALSLLWAIAEANGWELETAGSGWEALERVQAGTGSGAIVLDIAAGDSEGMHTLRWLRRVGPDLPIVVLSHSEDEEQRREALRLGAHEHLVRPLDEEQLEAVIKRCFAGRESIADPPMDGIEPLGEDKFFLAISPAMRKLRAQAELLAQVNAPLLLLGENGSGKELTARLIHKFSPRSGFRFLKVDCRLHADELTANELFASTGGRPSKLELCHKGTLFLDEITALPLGLQNRLLHVLQEGRAALRGEDREEGETDVRILAATAMNVEQAVAEGKMREDLYYRLSAFTVHVPALRHRKEEIPLLLGHFMKRLAKRHGLPARPWSQRVLDACQAYTWPGNVRELEDFVQHCLIASDDLLAPGFSHGDGAERPAAHSLRPTSEETAWTVAGAADRGAGTTDLKSLLQNVRGETEKNAITTALEQTRWNRKAAARLLKVSYRTLLYKIQQYHMKPPDSAYPYVAENGMKDEEHARPEFGPRAIRENRS
jgi:DNA-binding NtrC family response regulator